MTGQATKVVALCGGVGGAKLAYGLSRLLADGELAIVVNTGDDFEHLGLHISPDIDSVTYALAELDDPERGWGRRGESWRFMEALGELGGETWFQLGDLDLATHIERTRRLAAGESLSSVTEGLCRKLGVRARILPMSDASVRTVVESDQGSLAFQHYFVRERCAPRIRGLHFEGAETAQPTAAVLEALSSDALTAVVICPSNPYLSVDPMLAVPDLRQAVAAAEAPVVAVTPIVGGRAIKGPADKIMRELGHAPSPLTVAQHYGALIDGFVADVRDASGTDAGAYPTPVTFADTIMKGPAERKRLAWEVMCFAESLRSPA